MLAFTGHPWTKSPACPCAYPSQLRGRSSKTTMCSVAAAPSPGTLVGGAAQSTPFCWHHRTKGGARDKEPTCQCRRIKRCGFSPCVGKIAWKKAWQPTPILLPGARRATVHRVAKSGTQLKHIHTA